MTRRSRASLTHRSCLPAEAVDGRPHNPVVNYDVLSESADELETAYGARPLYQWSEMYGNRRRAVRCLADQVRTLLGPVLERRITFKDEQRPPFGTRIDTHLKIDVLRDVKASSMPIRRLRVT